MADTVKAGDALDGHILDGGQFDGGQWPALDGGHWYEIGADIGQFPDDESCQQLMDCIPSRFPPCPILKSFRMLHSPLRALPCYVPSGNNYGASGGSYSCVHCGPSPARLCNLNYSGQAIPLPVNCTIPVTGNSGHRVKSGHLPEGHNVRICRGLQARYRGPDGIIGQSVKFNGGECRGRGFRGGGQSPITSGNFPLITGPKSCMRALHADFRDFPWHLITVSSMQMRDAVHSESEIRETVIM